MSIRTRLLVFFTGFALVAIGLSALLGVVIVRDRAAAYAVQAFSAAREQVALSLRLRYRAFESSGDLSNVLEVVRQVATYKDRADWGFATPEADLERRAALHADLADAPWDWTGVSAGGFFALADYKGRVVYASTSRDAWGGDVLALAPAAQAFDPAREFRGAGVVAAEASELAATGLRPPGDARCFVLFARSIAPQGVPAAVFLQGIDADELLADVAIVDPGTRLALVGPSGRCAGSLPPAVESAGLALADEAPPAEVEAEGARWLVQRFPLRSLDERSAIATVLVARDLDIGLALLDEASTLLLLAALPLLALALVVATVVAGRLARPIVELEAAARRVAGGDLDVRVVPAADDELGRLAGAFNQMTEGLRDRDRIRETFRKYLAPEVVDFLLAHPEAQALGGQRRELTVLFSDLAGFTTLAERLEPEQVVARLNEYFTEVSARIRNRGGTIDKYLGDAVMAFFGAPVPRADHAARACLAALDHLAALEALRPRWQRDGEEELSVRVGVNTGEMVIGNIGGEQGQDYTVVGDAVNFASRLESANKQYGTRILVAEETWLAARGVVEGREIDVVRVKGKTRPMRIFEILAEAGGVDAARAEGLTRFAEGLALYRGRRFDEAVERFDAALVVCPGDGPAACLRDRAAALRAHPPAADWDGVFDLASK